MFQGRYNLLNQWRGFAALWVVYFHATFLIQIPVDLPAGILQTVGRIGWSGVHMFFVISGYCLIERASRALIKNERATSFLLDRALRIYPLYLFCLALAIGLAVLATPFNHQPLLRGLGESWGAFPASWTLLTDIFLVTPYFEQPSYLIVSWTLTCEIGLYVVVALGLSFSRVISSAKIPVVLGFVVAVLQVLGLVDLPSRTLDCWPDFMCGILAWQTLYWAESSRPMSVASCAGIVLLGLLDIAHPSSSGILAGSAIFSLVLVALKRHDERLSNSPCLRWLGFCGILSYPLYLLHMPIGIPAKNLMKRVFTGENHEFLITIVSFGATIPAAWAIHRWVEGPLENWRHARKKRLSAPPALEERSPCPIPTTSS